MRSGTVRLGAAVVVAAALGVLVTRVPDLLAGVELFRVRGVRLEGARFLTIEDVNKTVQIPDGASVWDDPDPWLEPLLRHPLVLAVDVDRELPDSLVLRVTERQPVALVPTPTLEPVDADGRKLPIDPSRHRLDLPLLRVEGPEGAADDARNIRPLARELDRLSQVDPSFVAMVSEMVWDARGDAMALWGDRGLSIRFHPPLAPERLRQAMAVLGDATNRYPNRRPKGVDLRYADQVVIRF